MFRKSKASQLLWTFIYTDYTNLRSQCSWKEYWSVRTYELLVSYIQPTSWVEVGASHIAYGNNFLSSVRLTGVAISDQTPRSLQLTVVFEYFFEFSKNSKKRVFCEYCVYLNADSEACGCSIDMVDSALET